MAKKIKLSDRQREAIGFMRNGYELGYSSGYNTNVWLQEGGCGKGGKAQKMTFGTFDALRDRGLIELRPNQGAFARPKIFQLTELGKSIEI